MDFLWDKITEWLKEMLVSGVISNLTGLFDATNQKVGEIAGQVSMTPQAWNASIFSMIQNLSNSVIVPIAGAILAFVMTLELIQLITGKNNLNDVDTWMFFKWAFKSAAAVLIVTNTWNIVMGVFDAAQSVVAMYEKNGQPLEIILRNMIQVCFIRPKYRPYRTNNFYAVLQRQHQLDKEVHSIVRQKAADPRRTEADRSSHRKSKPDG